MQSSTFNQVARPAVRDRSMIKLLVMNSFTFILLFLSFQLFAGDGLAQRVTLNFRNAKVEDVIKEIQRQTTYNFLYFESDLKNAKSVTLQCNDDPLERALDLLKVNQPFELVVEGTTILLRSHTSRDAIPPQVGTPAGSISGRITDPSGTPLGGATILIKRTQRGTQANANGEFKLADVREDDILVVSYTGFQSKSIPVGKGQQFPIVLEIAVKELDMFVRRGYGGVSGRLNVGNVSVVKGEEIARTNVPNPIWALNGKIPNVEIAPKTGSPYSPTKIELRGRDYIANNAAPNPYILIDGVPMTILDIGGQSTVDGTRGITQNRFNGPGQGQDLLFNLNAEDIESITVLKDAAATAIYGSLGGGGVILITTKRGKPGKPKLDVNVNTGISKVTKFHRMLSTEDYIMMRKEALANDNITPDLGNAPDLLAWEQNRYTDYQRLLYGRTGINNNVQISLIGGEKNTVYRISAGFSKIANITQFSGSNTKASLHSSFNYSSPNQRIKVGLVSFFSNSKVDEIGYSASHSLLPPNTPPIFDSLGRLNYKGWEPASYLFPFETLLQNYVSKVDFLNSQLSIEAEILNGLRLTTNIGYSTHRNTQNQKTPIASQNPEYSPEGGSRFGNNNASKWIIEPILSFQKLIGAGKLDLIVGGNFQKINQYGNSITGTGYANDNLLNSISNAPVIFASDVSGQYKYAAVFGRLNYSYRDRYLLEISTRRDGSSRFGPGNQYGNFGAIGVGWIFSEEKWFKNVTPIISFGKIRSSYGLVGSDNIGDYNFLSRWTANTSSVDPYQGVTAYAPIQHANPDLQWQENRKIEIGMHLGFLKDKIMLQTSWYRERCGNQLLSMPISTISGFGTVTANRNAVVQNSGWEFDLKSTIIKNRKIEWTANFNIGLNRNKLVSFPGIEKTSYANTLTVGEPLTRIQLMKFLGVNKETGLYMVEDINKDGVINLNSVMLGGDRYFIDGINLKFFGGFGSDFTWNSFSVSTFFSFMKRPLLPSGIFSSAFPGEFSTAGNQSVKVLDRWRKPGDAARFAKYTTQPDISYVYLQSSDGALSSGSFIRMRNIAVGYFLPTDLIRKIKLQSAKILVKADNLITITDFEGVDPEIPALGTVPTQKYVTIGIQISL